MTTKKKMTLKDATMQWKINTPAFIVEISLNDQLSIMKRPLQLLARKLEMVALRSLQLNDAILNKLMCDLALYEQADPYSKEYNKDMIKKVNKEYVKYINNLKK